MKEDEKKGGQAILRSRASYLDKAERKGIEVRE
jgi:hypothetical protein